MTLSSSDLGTSTLHEVEDNLQLHFARAKSWGAILLIDEADVYLERRSVSDVTRNGLVAGLSFEHRLSNDLRCGKWLMTFHRIPTRY